MKKTQNELKFKLTNLQLFADEDFSGGEEPEDYVPTTMEELGGMIGTIAEQTIREVSAEDKLSVFDKMAVDNGDTIEQVVVKMASPRAYDETGANALTRKTPAISVRLFKNWKREVYDTTVDISKMRKVLKTGKGASELSTKVVGELGEGDKFAKYSYVKELLDWGRRENALVSKSTIALKDGKIDYKSVLVQMKDIISGMQYVNDEFNTAEIKRRTLADDIYLLIPFKLKNRLDVEELAGVFNLEKDRINAHIIELDIEPVSVDGGTAYPVYIVDKWAILDYTRLYEMADQKNADGLFWNYFLHVERLYAISPLFDGCYFMVQATATEQAGE